MSLCVFCRSRSLLRLSLVLLQLRGGRGGERDLLQPRWEVTGQRTFCHLILRRQQSASRLALDSQRGEGEVGYCGLYKQSVLQIYDQSDRRLSRQSGSNFQVRDEGVVGCFTAYFSEGSVAGGLSGCGRQRRVETRGREPDIFISCLIRLV